MALVLALFIRTFIVQAFKIPSGSMIPTLQIGDHILVNKLSYGLRMPFLERYLSLEYWQRRSGATWWYSSFRRIVPRILSSG